MKRVLLHKTTKYVAKDQIKSDNATCFIGIGSPKSSTHAYSLAWGERANMLKYTSDDIAFVSAEGQRTGRVSPKAIVNMLEALRRAGGTALTDNREHTNRPYNIGEREVQDILRGLGFVAVEETEHFLVWKPINLIS